MDHESKPARVDEGAASVGVPGEPIMGARIEAHLPVSAAVAAMSSNGARRIPAELVILPTRDSVMFPGAIMPLNIGRDRSKAVVEHAMRGNKLLGVMTQRNREVDEPAPEHLHHIGTVCMILKMLTLPDGTLNVIVHGIIRFEIEVVVQYQPLLIAHIRPREDEPVRTPEIDALVHSAKLAAYRIFELSPNIPEEARVVLDNVETPGGVADFLGANLAVGTAKKQTLLEIFEVPARLRRANQILAEQTEVLELSTRIQTQVREQIDRQQREYFLNEQLKIIQRELGETDLRTGEITRLRERMNEAAMPKAACTEVERELARMARIPQASPEYTVAIDYVTWLCDLPWTATTPENLNLARAERILNEDHYDLQKVKQRIIEFLAVRKLKADGRGPILCFIGPPGVGKTSLGESIARALGRKFIRVSLGGLHDEGQLRGHRRTYVGAMPGRIIQELRKAGSSNPVFMLDEIDKLASDLHGDPASALLEILDPRQNNTFTDNYLDLPFDLSRVLFIATANYADGIPAPLRDRMEIIRLAGYTTQEKLFIAKRYLIPRQLMESGLDVNQVVFEDGIIDHIINRYTREAGVRALERQIAALTRGVAARVAKGHKHAVKISVPLIKRHLGPSRFDSERIQRTAQPGVAVGLAYTPSGGDILFIEATAMPGKGHLTMTGQIGDVMRESAQAAHSIIRGRADALGLDKRMLNNSDIHIHVPAGAVPKDGPSAGVAMLSAMVSLFCHCPCRQEVAMTGEITLTGRVLGVGGIKEKVLGARRAGITRIILPAENREDMLEIPADVRRQLKFVFVKHVEQVLSEVLISTRRRLPLKSSRVSSRRKSPR